MKYVIVMVVVVLLFRGFLYRLLVNYSRVRERPAIVLADEQLIKEIDERIDDKELSIEEIIDLSNAITSDKLAFTFDKVSSNANLVCKLEKGNCIGYSSLFNAVGNYILKKQEMADQYKFIHLVGKLDVLGFDVHRLIESPFFKDHDYNEIINLETRESKYVDPSLRDYARIDYVISRK